MPRGGNSTPNTLQLVTAASNLPPAQQKSQQKSQTVANVSPDATSYEKLKAEDKQTGNYALIHSTLDKAISEERQSVSSMETPRYGESVTNHRRI